MKPKSSTFSGRCLLTILLLMSTAALSAQNAQVRGKVTDSSRHSISGATVTIAGTTAGTTTGGNGEFAIQAARGQTLKVSFLGYKGMEVTVGNPDTYLEITLEDDSQLIDDVVVVGYGAVKKSDLTGSVASVKMDNIIDIPARSIDGLLQGRAAGVQVMNTSQDPGSGSTIRIRGNSSLRGSNTPLIVVNGFPMGDAGNLSQINVADIESVEVLKDASAAAIYGSRGANGVILVTTKNVKAGVTTVSAKHQTVISQLSDKLDIWYDPMLMAQVANEERLNAGLSPLYVGQHVNGVYYPSLIEIASGEWENTNWRDLTLRIPIVNNTTVTVNSSSERASLNLNVNYYDDQGMYKQDSYNKLNVNMGIRYKLFKNFTISTYNVASINNRNISNGLEYGRNPLWPVYNEDGSYFLNGTNDFSHPLVQLNEKKDRTTGRDFINSVAIDWEIISGLTLHSQVDYRFQFSQHDLYHTRNVSQWARDNDGRAQLDKWNSQNLLSETYLTYNKEFNKDHVLTVMGGHSYNYEDVNPLATTASGFINDVLQNENMNSGDPQKNEIYNNGYTQAKLLSFYGRVNYSLKDRYLFTFTMRADGSSKFSTDHKWGYFPSGAVSWKMHNEPWLNDVRWLSEMKLRVSYGVSGNQGISPYQTLDRYGSEKFWHNGKWVTVVGPGYEVGRTGANNRYTMWGGVMSPLKWESTSQLNAGIDVAFFNRRLRMTADFYNKKTYDLLREKYLPPSSGYDRMWVNHGEVLNRGFEISIDGDIIDRGDWGLSAGLIYSMNRNRVTDLGDAVSHGLSYNEHDKLYYEVAGPALSMFNQNVSIFAVGQPMYAFYGYQVDGIIQKDTPPTWMDPNGVMDRPGEFNYVDRDGDGEITDKDRTIIGDPNPDFTASLNISARWKKLDFSVFLYSVVGHDVIYNGYTFMPRVKAKRWTPDNPTNDFPRLNDQRSTLLSDYFIQDGSFLRIQNVNIGYTIDFKKSFVKGLRIYANIENLYTFTKFDGYDPEVGIDGIYWGGFPKFRKYTVGVDLKF